MIISIYCFQDVHEYGTKLSNNKIMLNNSYPNITTKTSHPFLHKIDITEEKRERDNVEQRK
jgi:hypothetical protein